MKFCVSLLKDKEEAENVVHEVFLKIWDKRQSINPELNFTSYLFTSLKNRIFDHFKEIKRSEVLRKQYFDRVESYRDEHLEEKEIKTRRIQKAIENLSQRRKRILKLNIEEGLSYSEIATKLDISPNTVKNSLVKAKQMIRRQLDLGIS
jgi:RNA polymerase sigma-70 factor (ECF subfamily)